MSDKVIAQQKKSMEAYQQKREFIFSKVQTIFNASATLDHSTVGSFRPRYDKLRTLETEFSEIQHKIMDLNVSLIDPNEVLEVNQVQAAFDELVFVVQGKFIEASKLLTPPVSNSSQNDVAALAQNSRILPTIKIPTFKGELAMWPEFFSLFSSLVHENAALSPVQKFQYLRSSLEGNAAAVISAFHLSAENYELAFQALQNRFQNKRRLASMYLEQIRSFSVQTNANYSSLQHFLNVHQNSVSALLALRIPNLTDFILFHFALHNLDTQSRTAFENKINTGTIPSYKDLMTFVTGRVRTMELSMSDSKVAPNPKPPSIKRPSSLLTSAIASKPNSFPCALCKGEHRLYQCSKFLAQDIQQRRATIKSLKRCFNCLGAHFRTDCLSTSSCRTCKSNQHHSLLHTSEVSAASSPVATPSCSTPQSLACNASSTSTHKTTVLLGTIRALIQDSLGDYHSCRGVIDTGSQVSILTNSLVQRLGLPISKGAGTISGISESAVKCFGSTICSIKPRDSLGESLMFKSLVLSRISNPLPSVSISADVVDKFKNFTLADDSFHTPARVDFLLGADIYSDVIGPSREFISGHPCAMLTRFGWVILGSAPAVTSIQNSILLVTLTCELSHALRQFWESEEVATVSFTAPEDDICEKHFIDTHSQNLDGRYVVKLPFKPDATPIGDNRSKTRNCFLSLERRLQQDPQTSALYEEFLQEYLKLGHMELAPRPSSYVIPHHGVLKASSSTTKLCVVFNASAKDDSGFSLNDRLLSGPKLQRDLSALLISFRLHRVALCADIKMMYRQISISPEDRAHQYIFWRDASGALQEYELTTVTYGMVPSAFLSQRVLQQLAKDKGTKFPYAALSLSEHTYVDDIVTGAPSIEEARHLCNELIALLKCGQFELRKWSTSHPSILSNLPHDHLETPLIFNEADSSTFKILRLKWDSKSDCFLFYVVQFDDKYTKRTLLSFIARIFDPLGFLSPFTFLLKHFMQQLWLDKLSWDETLPPHLTHTWLQLVNCISSLSNIRIPRLICSSSVYRLIGFSDASERGFSAVLYLHVSTLDCSGRVSLLKARTKVSPLKTLSIPRLELAGALLLSLVLSLLYEMYSKLFN